MCYFLCEGPGLSMFFSLFTIFSSLSTQLFSTRFLSLSFFVFDEPVSFSFFYCVRGRRFFFQLFLCKILYYFIRFSLIWISMNCSALLDILFVIVFNLFFILTLALSSGTVKNTSGLISAADRVALAPRSLLFQ